MTNKIILSIAVGLMLTATMQASRNYVIKADTIQKDTTTVDTTKATKNGSKATAKKSRKRLSIRSSSKKVVP